MSWILRLYPLPLSVSCMIADHIAIYIKPILNCLRQTINIYIEYWYFLVWRYDFRSWGYGYDMVTYHHNVYGSGIFSWADVFHPQTTSIANSPGPGPGASGHWQFLGKLVMDDCIRVTSTPGTCWMSHHHCSLQWITDTVIYRYVSKLTVQQNGASVFPTRNCIGYKRGGAGLFWSYLHKQPNQIGLNTLIFI